VRQPRRGINQRPQGLIAGESGAIALIMALALVVFLGMAALVVDYGYMAVVQNELKKAAEAGALAGALALPPASNPNWSAGQLAAENIVTENFAAGQQLTGCQVSPGYWDQSKSVDTAFDADTTKTPSSSEVAAIRVVVARSAGNNGGPIQLSFAPILGINTANLSGTAVAVLKPTQGIWSILETGNGTVSLSNNANVSSDMGVNGDGPFSLSNNATVQGKAYLKTGCSKNISNGAVVQGGIQQDAGANAILQQAAKAATDTFNTFKALKATPGTVTWNPKPSKTNVIDLSNNGELTITGGATQNVLVLTKGLSLSNNSTLTLNAPAGGSFVIRVSSTFSLGNNSQVILTGGITEDKVTFVRTGTDAVDFSNNSIFNGNILSLNGAISLSNNAAVTGVLVSGKNISLSNNSVTTNKIPSGWGSFSSGGSGQGAALVQ
jgi:Flp pilus assembly protein TadG